MGERATELMLIVLASGLMIAGCRLQAAAALHPV